MEAFEVRTGEQTGGLQFQKKNHKKIIKYKTINLYHVGVISSSYYYDINKKLVVKAS